MSDDDEWQQVGPWHSLSVCTGLQHPGFLWAAVVVYSWCCCLDVVTVPSVGGRGGTIPDLYLVGAHAWDVHLPPCPFLTGGVVVMVVIVTVTSIIQVIATTTTLG